MLNQKIGAALRFHRKRNGLSVRDVAIALENEYQLKVAEKTIYGWESNQAHPTTDTFLILCELYQIHNISKAFSDTPDSLDFGITADEKKLIMAYRNHPDMQKAVNQLLDIK